MIFPWLFHDPIPFSMTRKDQDAKYSNAANQIMYSLIQYLMQSVPCEHENTAWSYRVFSKTTLSKNIYWILYQSCWLIIQSLKFLSCPLLSLAMHLTCLRGGSNFSLQPALQDLLFPVAFLPWTLSSSVSWLSLISSPAEWHFASSPLFLQLSFSHHLDADNSIVSLSSNSLEVTLLWNNQAKSRMLCNLLKATRLSSFKFSISISELRTLNQHLWGYSPIGMSTGSSTAACLSNNRVQYPSICTL